ncbi:MAG: RHS repeat-associated core domain-containing protein [Thermoplasmata archaeon]
MQVPEIELEVQGVCEAGWGSLPDDVGPSCAALEVDRVGDGTVSSQRDIGRHTWTTNSATNQPWTVAEVNALQAGFTLDSTNWIVRVTQLYVTVDLADSVTSTTYAYADGPTGMNGLLSTSGVEPASFAYTFNGDLWTKTQGVTWTYAYNEMGLLKEVKEGPTVKATYFYDGLGRRVKATENGATTYFVYGLGLDPIWEKTGTTETRHLYANGMRIARMVVGGSTYYYHADALGSTWRITDASKATVLSTSYEPFGRSWGTTGTLAATERYRFLGERNDTESGLTYLRARQYDPKTGRFTSMDPVLGALGMPQTLNRYTYVANNPQRFVDPTGKFFEDVDWAAVGAFLAGAAVVAGVIACGVLTGGVCIGVAGALILAGVAGAGAAVAITAAQGRPVTLETAVGGALLGIFGGTLVYGAAAAGVFGPAAAEAAFGMSVGPSMAGSALGGFFSRVRDRLFGRPGGAGAGFEGPPRRVVLNQDWHGYQYGTRQGYSTQWASPTRYTNPSQARAALSLPPWNDAAFVRPVTIPRGSVVWQGRAAALFGQPGGGMQVWVSNPSTYVPGPWTSIVQLYYVWE